MSEDDDLRAWLGLGREERLVFAAGCRRPPSDVGEGRTVAEAPTSIHALVEDVRARPDLSPATGGSPFARARFWDVDPAVVIVDVRGAARARGDAVALGEGSWLLDGRSRAAWLAVEDEGGTAVVCADDAGVRWMRVERGEQSEDGVGPDTSRWSHAVQAWLGEEAAQPWLIEEAQRLASSSNALGVAAAAGLVARLWSPPPGASRRAALERRLSGRDGPVTNVRRWAQARPRSEWRAVEDAAIVEADGCARAIVTLCVGGWSDPSHARRALVTLAVRRDDLESVAFVLRAVGRADAISRALAALDDTAASHLSTLSWLGFDADERTSAVAWQEPSAWWGALGSPR